MGSQSKWFIPLIVLIIVGLSSSFVLLQDTGPAASPPPHEAGGIDLGRIPLGTPGGHIAALATVAENPQGVTITVTSNGDSGLTPGKHGVHIHRVGACDASGNAAYMAAGDHFDTGDHEHGSADSKESHAGDLGNLTVNDDGTIDFKKTTRRLTLQPGETNSLDNPAGSSIVIHAAEDDHHTQPSGNSGAREACGIIFRSHEPVTHYMPGYEGVATPEATPAS